MARNRRKKRQQQSTIKPESNQRRGKGQQSRGITERRAEVWRLRRMGFTVDAIVNKLQGSDIECSRSTVYDDLKKVADELIEQSLDDAAVVRTRQLEQIASQMQRLLNRMAPKKDPEEELPFDSQMQALDRLMKLWDKEAKLTGADKPTKIAPTNPEGDKPYESVAPQDAEERLLFLLRKAQQAKAESEAA